MIGLECRRIRRRRRRRRSNKFNNVLLNVQDKVNCNKITEIREEKIANSFYLGSTPFHAYVQSSSNPLEIFHYLCKFFTTSEHVWIPLPGVQDSHKSRDEQSLDHNNGFIMYRRISLF